MTIISACLHQHAYESLIICSLVTILVYCNLCCSPIPFSAIAQKSSPSFDIPKPSLMVKKIKKVYKQKKSRYC